MTGLAQKGGAVYSHLRILPTPSSVAPLRLGLEDADLAIASDVVAATQLEALKTVGRSTTVLVDDQVVATQTFHENGNIELDAERLVRRLERRAERQPVRVPANDLARRAFGDPVSANMIMLGYALQMGALRLSPEAMEQAIRLHGADVAGTLSAFRLGRLYFADPEMAGGLLALDKPATILAPSPSTRCRSASPFGSTRCRPTRTPPMPNVSVAWSNACGTRKTRWPPAQPD